MNWLAHIFFSRNIIDHQLGNLLADHLKRRSWAGASRQVEDGFKMHGSIDAFTDSSECVSASKARLGSKGYLRGVIIDVAYDHLLIKNWDQYSKVALGDFVDVFNYNAHRAIENYPHNASRFVKRVIDSGVLTSYGTLTGLGAAFRRIDDRLSARLLARESATGYLPVLVREMDAIEGDFSVFFPQLAAHFKKEVGSPLTDHWLV